ncbi:MAG TPA: FAD-dependent monooxygenase [Actinomycetota bacterium]|nr:FAD-dependent monooxygenase [Actinomycetota bacterium]
MKISVLGGGPAGLYFALLMKRSDPDHDITVTERNPAGATYGWGVVFSDRTLGSFREADMKSYEDMSESLITWDAIDIKYRGETIRCEGQAFAGLGRRKLLQILQDHCRSLGVVMAFEEEVPDPSLLTSADLVVAADGVHSLTRKVYEKHFRPRVVHGRSRFVWFGTTMPFDSFTFIFRTNAHGLFQVHAYPFDGTTSTFIVECNEDVWANAGLDRATEDETVAYCEELFADDLHGHRLLTNRSLWQSFATVTNAAWTHGNVALVGDAAHTAHFTIGSGTKLAMEDAIALASALTRQQDLPGAFGEYEAARKPLVKRFQKAARQSQRYFENTARYLHLDAPQFAFHLLSRSGRMGYGDLRVRDERLMSRIDAWFAASARSVNEHGGAPISPPPAFIPLRSGRLALANRIAMEVPELASGVVAGAALVMTERVAVSAIGRISPRDPGIYLEEHVAKWSDVVARSSSGSALMGICLSHAGRRAATADRSLATDVPLAHDAWRPLAPSAIPYGRRAQVPLEMTEAQMKDVEDEFVTATGRAARAGFDVLKLDMSHGYLLASFISPISNHRTDGYGGETSARFRFPLSVFDAVRAEWPEDKALSVSLGAVDWESGGTSLDDAVWIAQHLKEHGCDLVEVTAGQASSGSRSYYDPYLLTSYSDRIRNDAGIPTAATGMITSIDDVNTIVAGGRADVCYLLAPLALRSGSVE